MKSEVSIPFREFKCCRPYYWDENWSPCAGFQSLSGNSSVVGFIGITPFKCGICKFQSLSGNSSVVGKPDKGSITIKDFVSIPFREFKCCRTEPESLPVSAPGFNPFQGIQVLSAPSISGMPTQMFFQFQSLSGNSSVVGQYKVGLIHIPQLEFQSLSGNSSVVGLWSCQYPLKQMKFQSLSGNSSVVGL